MEEQKETKEKNRQFHFQKLTPSDEIDLGIYDDAIEYAFSNEDICNIALSGAYGAGKSSVIESYKKMHPEKKFVHISLAHVSDAGQKEDISVAELEGKIINQLVHLIPVEQIPQTNFAVKRKVDADRVLKYTIYIILFLLFGGYLFFYHNWCNVVAGLWDKSFRDLLSFTTKKEFVLFSGVVCVAMFSKICYEMVKWQMNRRFLRKVNVKGKTFDIELFDTQEASYFDKYLNEVLYLFENVDAHAVVFEDMDRYNTQLIFEGLKEINALLNRKRNLCEEKKKPLRFIYLLRDDMFMTKERTKFFDYIIPVVPVIDGSNSYDKFIELFRDVNIADLFEDDFLRGLSLYIDDMRILKNIVNEFVIYHGKFKKSYAKPVFVKHGNGKKDNAGQGGKEDACVVPEYIQTSNGRQDGEQDKPGVDAEPGDTEQNDNKLLAMIAYKNMFPRDFVELQVSRGYVYQLFHLKEDYAQKRIKDIQAKIKDLERMEKESNEEECRSLDELDAIYFIERNPINVNHKEVHEFATRVDYIREIKENHYAVKTGRPTYGDYVWSDANIKNGFDALLSNPEYAARKEKIENKAKERREQIQSQIAAYRKEQEQLRSAYLKNIITKENADEIFAKPKEHRVGGTYEFSSIKLDPYFPLIKYLVRNGYIDETYPDYMTFFYANSISRQDKIFLRSITDEKAKDYDYALQSPKAVIARMRPVDFGAKECWNYNLLDALLEGKDTEKYRAYLDEFLESLRQWKPVDFVAGYIRHSHGWADFIQAFNASWDGAVSWVIKERSLDEEIKYRYVRATFIESMEQELVRYNVDGELTQYISNQGEFLHFNQSEVLGRAGMPRIECIPSPDIENIRITELERVLNQEKVINRLKALNVKFPFISYKEADMDLLEAVYNEDMYVLNWDMIHFFLEHMYHIEPSDEYHTKNLTLVFSQEQPLANYVKNHFAEYINMQIAHIKSSVEQSDEDTDTVLYVLNHKEIEDKKKGEYIKLWKRKLPELSAVEDRDLWEEMMQSSISDSPKNIFDYFFLSGNGMDETLTNYINQYEGQLAFDTSGLDEEYHDSTEAAGARFFWQLVKNNHLEDEKYRQLIQSFHMQGQKFYAKDISQEKVQILMEEKVIRMSLANLHFLRVNYPESVYGLIEGDTEEYINIMTKEALVEDEVAYVLQMDISDEAKIRLLELETNPVSVMHKNYSSKVIVYILQHLLDENEKEQLLLWYPDKMPDVQAEIRRIALEDIEGIISGKMRIKKDLLNDLLIGSKAPINDMKMLLANNLPDLHRDEVEIYLDELGLNGFHHILEGKSQMFQGTEANISLLKAFQEKGWVSHFEVALEDENIYTAYGCEENEVNVS